MMVKTKSAEAKINSTLMKDINRIRGVADKQIKMNILRKHQINLLDNFLKKLLKEGRITKEELRPFMPRKKIASSLLFQKRKEN